MTTAAALLNPDVPPEVIERFRSSGVEIRIRENAADAKSCTAALIFGGDGTVHRHLPELYKQQIPTLVVPAGSGNDFAKAMGITSIEVALQAWKQFCASGSNVKRIDLGVITSGGQEILFCCVAGLGMDAEANRRANGMPAWLKGKGGYMLAALWSLAAFRPVEMRVTTPEREIHESAFFVAVGNAHRYGGGMKVTPRARPDDGLLDICVVPGMNKLKLLCWVPTIFFGGHLRLRGVEYFQTERVRIDPVRALEVYADGDYVCRTPVEIRVIPRAMTMIVPDRIASS